MTEARQWPGLRVSGAGELDLYTPGGYSPPAIYGYAENKDALVRRLHRIEGQVRGIERMLEEDRYCIDILTQVGAVSTALERFAFEILDDHVTHCVAGALASGDEETAKAKTAELLAAVQRFAKTH